MTTKMNLINKIIACKSILLLSLFFSAPHALSQQSESAESDDGVHTYYANHYSGVNGENDWALSQLSSAISDTETNEWVSGSQVRTDNYYDATTDTATAQVNLGAAASSFCTGGSNDQCGAQISMGQTAVGGVNNGSTINMSAATVRINGNVSLGSVGDNGSYVGDLAAYVTTNRATAQDNGTDIATNAADIATNVTAIATNAAGVSANAAGVATNVTAIATNAAGVSANIATLTAHTTAIGTNMTAIGTNMTAIGTNMTAIGNLQSSFANFQTETMDNFARMGSDMHRGLAEVTALSNVAYADKGWRASVGYGDYESKSAAAVGISYAGERFKFKVSRSGKATGAGIAFDF